MAKENPFKASMVTLYVPEGMGLSFAVGGFEVDADEKDRSVEVPKQHADDLRAHGLTDKPPAKAGK